MHTEQAGGEVVSKGEFARRRNVTPTRVGQWIREGKIGGDALVGEGRRAQIREAVAVAQLNRTLDVNQRYGNGLSTRLDVEASSVAARGPAGPASSGEAFVDTGDGDRPADQLVVPPKPALYGVNDQIARERLAQLQRANREAERQEAVAAGLLTDANAVRQEMAREIAKLMNSLDAVLVNIATALAAELKAPQRDVLHVLRGEYRKFRAAEADAVRAAAERQPQTIEYDLPSREDSPAETPPAVPASPDDDEAAA